MNVRSHNKKNKKFRTLNSESADSSLFQKEKDFKNSYSIGQKVRHYQALIDPHTTYYFSNRSIKLHLKSLKKSLNKSCHNKQQQKVKKLITYRLEQIQAKFVHHQELAKSQTENISKKTMNTLYSKAMQRTFANTHLKLKNLSKQPENIEQDDLQESTHLQNFSHHCGSRNKSKPSQLQVSHNLFEQLHKKKRQKWLNFLQLKKCALNQQIYRAKQ